MYIDVYVLLNGVQPIAQVPREAGGCLAHTESYVLLNGAQPIAQVPREAGGVFGAYGKFVILSHRPGSPVPAPPITPPRPHPLTRVDFEP